MERLFRLAASGIFAVLALSLSLSTALPSPAAALSTICDGDCSVLGAAPQLPNGELFDFSLGLEAVSEGLALDLIADGNVFLVGPIESLGDVVLHTPLSIWLDGSIRAAGQLEIDAGPILPGIPPILPPLTGGGGIILNGATLEIVSIGEVEVLEANGLYLDGSGDIRLAGAAIGASPAEGVLPMIDAALRPAVDLHTKGDVYLDLSQIALSSLRIKALGSIVLRDQGLDPVPEPGTALLMGLGLIGLSLVRHDASRYSQS